MDTRVTLSILNPTQLNHSLPQNKASVQTVGVSNQSRSVFKSEPIIPFQLGNMLRSNTYSYSQICPNSPDWVRFS